MRVLRLGLMIYVQERKNTYIRFWLKCRKTTPTKKASPSSMKVRKSTIRLTPISFNLPATHNRPAILNNQWLLLTQIRKKLVSNRSPNNRQCFLPPPQSQWNRRDSSPWFHLWSATKIIMCKPNKFRTELFQMFPFTLKISSTVSYDPISSVFIASSLKITLTEHTSQKYSQK